MDKANGFPHKSSRQKVASLIKNLYFWSVMSIETRFNISPKKEAQCALWIAYSATASTGFTTTSFRGLNEISHIHRHLLHCSIVESLNVSQDPLVLFSDKIDSHTFSAKTATPANSAQKENTFTPKLTSPICFTCFQHPFINCSLICHWPVYAALTGPAATQVTSGQEKPAAGASSTAGPSRGRQQGTHGYSLAAK